MKVSPNDSEPRGLTVAMLIPDNRDELRDYDNPTPYFGPAPTALLEGLAKHSEIQVHVLSCAKRPMHVPEKLADNIWFHLLHVAQWGWLRSMYMGCVQAVRRKLQEIQPDIVHGQGTERYCALAAAFSGFPNVITIHGNMLGMAKTIRAKPGSHYWLASKLESLALRKTRGTLCNSRYTTELVHRRTKRCWNVPNALREIFFRPLPSRTQGGKTFLLNVGTIAPYKKQIEILEVARRLFKAGYHFHLNFVGGHNPSSRYAKEFVKLISAAVRDGFASYSRADSELELLRFFDESDALIHFPTEEAFGLVVAEALARNLKLFATRTGGIPDIASNAEMAELYDENDWTGLYDGLARWMEGGSRKPKHAAQEMAKRYHPTLLADRHIEVYRDVILQTHAPSEMLP